MVFWAYLLYLRLAGRSEWKVLFRLEGIARRIGVPIILRFWRSVETSMLLYSVRPAEEELETKPEAIILAEGLSVRENIFALAHELGHALYMKVHPGIKFWGRLKQEEAAWIAARDILVLVGEGEWSEEFEAHREDSLCAYYKDFGRDILDDGEEIPHLDISRYLD